MCVAGRGRADAHVGRLGVEKGVPIIGVDYGYLWRRTPEALDASHDEVAGEDPPDGVRTSSPEHCGLVDLWSSLSGKRWTTSGIVQYWQKSCKLEATAGWLCVVMVNLRCWYT